MVKALWSCVAEQGVLAFRGLEEPVSVAGGLVDERRHFGWDDVGCTAAVYGQQRPHDCHGLADLQARDCSEQRVIVLDLRVLDRTGAGGVVQNEHLVVKMHKCALLVRL